MTAITEAPARCPYGRSRSKLTGQYSIDIGYDDLQSFIDDIDQLWETLEDTFPIGEAIGNQFVAILDRIVAMQQWTGWGGVPGIYTGNDT